MILKYCYLLCLLLCFTILMIPVSSAKESDDIQQGYTTRCDELCSDTTKTNLYDVCPS